MSAPPRYEIWRRSSDPIQPHDIPVCVRIECACGSRARDVILDEDRFEAVTACPNCPREVTVRLLFDVEFPSTWRLNSSEASTREGAMDVSRIWMPKPGE